MKTNMDKWDFYFQVRESPAPLNIPTPIPAPDRGPIACLSGPVAFMKEDLVICVDGFGVFRQFRDGRVHNIIPACC